MSVVTFPIEAYTIFYTPITENKNANWDTILSTNQKLLDTKIHEQWYSHIMMYF